jgi:hypothetical protein
MASAACAFTNSTAVIAPPDPLERHLLAVFIAPGGRLGGREIGALGPKGVSHICLALFGSIDLGIARIYGVFVKGAIV